MQSVSVYLREGRYIVSVIHGSGGGDPCLEAGPAFAFDAAATDVAALGTRILESLALSTNDMPWPTDWKKVTEPLLSTAGVKTWNTFAKRATNVRVDRTNGDIGVRATRRDEKNAFQDVPEKAQNLSAPSPAALGAVVAELLR